MTEVWPAVKISDANPIDRAMILKLQCRNIIGYASGHSDAQVSARYLRDFASIVKKVLSLSEKDKTPTRGKAAEG